MYFMPRCTASNMVMLYDPDLAVAAAGNEDLRGEETIFDEPFQHENISIITFASGGDRHSM